LGADKNYKICSKNFQKKIFGLVGGKIVIAQPAGSRPHIQMHYEVEVVLILGNLHLENDKCFHFHL
jgi:hypothetical protein